MNRSVDVNAFFAQHGPFLFRAALCTVASDGAVRANHAMAGDFGCKRVLAAGVGDRSTVTEVVAMKDYLLDAYDAFSDQKQTDQLGHLR